MIRYPAVRIVASSIQDSQIYEGEIRLWQEDDWWIAKDVETGVTTEGDSREAVLEILDARWHFTMASVVVRQPTSSRVQRGSTATPDEPRQTAPGCH